MGSGGSVLKFVLVKGGELEPRTPEPLPPHLGMTTGRQHRSALKKGDGSFAPAHMLADGRLERSGRATKKVGRWWLDALCSDSLL